MIDTTKELLQCLYQGASSRFVLITTLDTIFDIKTEILHITYVLQHKVTKALYSVDVMLDVDKQEYRIQSKLQEITKEQVIVEKIHDVERLKESLGVE